MILAGSFSFASAGTVIEGEYKGEYETVKVREDVNLVNASLLPGEKLEKVAVRNALINLVPPQHEQDILRLVNRLLLRERDFIQRAAHAGNHLTVRVHNPAGISERLDRQPEHLLQIHLGHPDFAAVIHQIRRTVVAAGTDFHR